MSVLEIALTALSGSLGVVAIVFWSLWLGGRRRQRVLRGEIAALKNGRKPRKLVPTPQETVKAVWETATLVRDRGVGGALRTSVEELADWARVERPDLERMATRDGTVTILFSDIVGSTELNSELGDRSWVRLLARHDRLVRRAVERHGGHVVKTQGDGFMVGFAGGPDAVRCAVEVQQGQAKHAEVEVRIGIHRGRVVHRSGDILGRNVAQAARIAGLADGGEILLSDAVAETLGDERDLEVTEAYEAELKGIVGTHALHAVDWRP